MPAPNTGLALCLQSCSEKTIFMKENNLTSSLGLL